jgi:hypothetical protein
MGGRAVSDVGSLAVWPTRAHRSSVHFRLFPREKSLTRRSVEGKVDGGHRPGQWLTVRFGWSG